MRPLDLHVQGCCPATLLRQIPHKVLYFATRPRLSGSSTGAASLPISKICASCASATRRFNVVCDSPCLPAGAQRALGLARTTSTPGFGELRAHRVVIRSLTDLNPPSPTESQDCGVGEDMMYLLAFAFFIGCLIVERFRNKRATGNVLEPASQVNAGLERATGKLVFGEHWQAWADAISREAAEPWEEQAA